MLRPRQQAKLARGTKDEEHAMSHKLDSAIAVIGIDIGKNSFHIVGHDKRGANGFPIANGITVRPSLTIQQHIWS